VAALHAVGILTRTCQRSILSMLGTFSFYAFPIDTCFCSYLADVSIPVEIAALLAKSLGLWFLFPTKAFGLQPCRCPSKLTGLIMPSSLSCVPWDLVLLHMLPKGHLMRCIACSHIFPYGPTVHTLIKGCKLILGTLLCSSLMYRQHVFCPL
jgi:hypothetical protein